MLAAGKRRFPGHDPRQVTGPKQGEKNK